MYSTMEAATRLGISQSHLRYLLANGKINGKQEGKGHRWIILNLNYEKKRNRRLSNVQANVLRALSSGSHFEDKEGRRKTYTIEISTGDKRLVHFMARIQRLQSTWDGIVMLTVIRLHGRFVCQIRCHRSTPDDIWHSVYNYDPRTPILWEENIPLKKVHIVPKLKLAEDLNTRWLLNRSRHKDVVYQIGLPDGNTKNIVRNTTLNVLQRLGLILSTKIEGKVVWSLTDKGNRALIDLWANGRRDND